MDDMVIPEIKKNVENYFFNLHEFAMREMDFMIDAVPHFFFGRQKYIDTYVTSDLVRSKIDLSDDPLPEGIEYDMLEINEDVGRFATEQYIFQYLDSIFLNHTDKENGGPGNVMLEQRPDGNHATI